MCLTVKEKENQVINLLLGYNQRVNFLHPDGLERLRRAIVPSREWPERNRTMNFLTIEIQQCPWKNVCILLPKPNQGFNNSL